MKVYQPVAYIQGNGMQFPGHTEGGPLFLTRYQAKKWADNNWYTVNYVKIKSRTVFEKAKDA